MKKIFTLIIILFTISTIYAQENEYVKNGLFIDALIGGSSLSSHYNRGLDEIGLFSLNARIGSKWYFSDDNKFNSGFQLTYARLGFSIGSVNLGYGRRQTIGFFNLLPMNVGYTGYLVLNDDLGLETNLNLGPGFAFNANSILLGLHVNPEIKLRYKNLSVGMDFSFLNARNFSNSSYYWYSHNTYSIVAGLKF